MNDPGKTPVLVAIGFAEQKLENPAEALEPILLMTRAVQEAIRDAGVPALSSQMDSIRVPQGFWKYSDPARLIAEAIGADSARTELSGIGVLQQTLINRACLEIASGQERLSVIVGGEAKYRSHLAWKKGVSIQETVQAGVTPDSLLESEDPIWTDYEASRGLVLPGYYFSIIESALRAEEGLSFLIHQEKLANLYSGLTKIASQNPHAWSREEKSPKEILHEMGSEKMISFPYAKIHNSQWNVDQASALILMSLELAQELGIPQKQWIFPLASTESHHVVPLSAWPSLSQSSGTRIAGKRVLELAGYTPQEVDFFELYSCFPAAIRLFAQEMGLPEEGSWSVTGGMPFAGGPLNNFVLQGTARMAEVLRENPGSRGLVTSLSGIAGKQGFAIWSTSPPRKGFLFEDVTREVREENPAKQVQEEYEGEARIVGYTVLYKKGTPIQAIAICDLPNGARTLAFTEDASCMQAMVQEEFCGRRVQIAAPGKFEIV